MTVSFLHFSLCLCLPLLLIIMCYQSAMQFFKGSRPTLQFMSAILANMPPFHCFSLHIITVWFVYAKERYNCNKSYPFIESAKYQIEYSVQE